MKIELLSFIVNPPSKVEDFIDLDAKVWNPWLKLQPGYIRKIATLYPNGRVDFRLFWKDKSALDKASKDTLIPTLEARLRNQFTGSYRRLN